MEYGKMIQKEVFHMQKRKHFKRYIFSLLILCYALIASGCGTGGTKNSNLSLYDSGSEAVDESSEESEEQTSKTDDENTNKNKDSEQGIDGTSNSEKNNTSTEINTDMLVYTCKISIDTLNYDTSINDFKSMLSAVNGFIEKESYSDGQSSDSYYVEESEKDKVYKATVRVPQNKYDEFLGGADKLGDVRSKSSKVENVSQEYTDLNTSLEIYEAKEKRYIKLLSTITDDSHAISVEKELTELQVKIAEIKTRMNEIKTDVSYSTISITINEVSKYEEEPEKTDTFWQRLSNTVKNTWKNFLDFMEILLFFLISASPYIIILVLIILAIYYYQKKVNAKKRDLQKDKSPESGEGMIDFTDYSGTSAEKENDNENDDEKS